MPSSETNGRRPLVAYHEGQEMRDELAVAAEESNERVLASAFERRRCVNCGRKLNANNTHETCSGCRAGGVPAPAQEAAPSESLEVLARFRQAAVLFGLNPDEMIADYCRGWLEAVSSAAKRRK